MHTLPRGTRTPTTRPRRRPRARTLAAALVAAAATTLAPAGDAAVAGTGYSRDPTTESWERSIVRLTNIKRAAVGCPAVRLHTGLRRAARVHSVAMARAGRLSHQLPGEPSLGERVEEAGYVGWRRVSENVASGFRSPRLAMRTWWSSAGHRRNIADCFVRETGVGVVYDDAGRSYWTQVFGRR